MSRVWLGDFRLQTLNAYLSSLNINDLVFIYDYASTRSDLAGVKDLLIAANASIIAADETVIMLGLTDCINCCILDEKVDTYVTNLMATLSEAKITESGSKILICPILPIDGDYVTSMSSSGIITKDALSTAINNFNNILKSKCTEDLVFVDCFDYFKDNDFLTIDGVNYSVQTCERINRFINHFMLPDVIPEPEEPDEPDEPSPPATGDTESKTYFKVRTVAPNGKWNNKPMEAAFCQDNYGGASPKETVPKKWGEAFWGKGSTIPNCTAYAWGRWYEMIGDRIYKDFYKGDAGTWYGRTADGYDRGTTPKEGAIICWEEPGKAGHVAVVEEIIDDETILISQSAWRDGNTASAPSNIIDDSSTGWTWNRRKIYNNNKSKPWNFGTSYNFQGFIYLPSKPASETKTKSISRAASTDLLKKADLCMKDSYNITKNEMQPTALYIYKYLTNAGWTKNAIAALLGNMEQESKLSPMQWEKPYLGKDGKYQKNYGQYMSPAQKTDDGYYINNALVERISTCLGRSSKTKVGFGLTQWTPYTKYIDWCNNGSGEGNGNGTGKVLPFWDIDSQLLRILAEVEVNSKKGWVEGLDQWIRKEDEGYDLSFAKFTKSNESVRYLAAAFAYCYERPGSSTGSAEEQAALKKTRGDLAEYWLNYLNDFTGNIEVELGGSSTGAADEQTAPVPLDPPATKPLVALDCLQTGYKKDTAASLLMLIKNFSTGTLTLNKNNTKVTSAPITNDQSKIYYKTVFSKLEPNTEYESILNITDLYDEVHTETITFSTEQSKPDNVQKVNLTADKSLSPSGSIKLVIKQPKTFGYWKTVAKKTCGYKIYVYVNGMCVKNDSVVCDGDYELTKINLSSHKYFKDIKLTYFDNIQIGAQAWVFDNNNQEVLSDSIVASPPLYISPAEFSDKLYLRI